MSEKERWELEAMTSDQLVTCFLDHQNAGVEDLKRLNKEIEQLGSDLAEKDTQLLAIMKNTDGLSKMSKHASSVIEMMETEINGLLTGLARRDQVIDGLKFQLSELQKSGEGE